MDKLRIVSFLPSATEMVCALGLAEQLVGISHECDYPPSVRGKPVVVHSAIPLAGMNLGEINVAVSEQLRSGGSLYAVDEDLLRELSPTHILTQNLCQVCAPAGNEVTRALKALRVRPHVLWMSPHSIEDIHNDLRNLAQLTGRSEEAKDLITNNQERLHAVAERVRRDKTRLRVFCAEWIDPLYCCGHWVPEMIEIAEGVDILGRKWADSVRVTWDDVFKGRPEVVIVMPCGFDLAGSVAQAEQLIRNPKCAKLPAVESRQVYAVDAGYFSRPSLRVIDGTELLAHILHPHDCPWEGTNDAYRRISLGEGPRNVQLTKQCPECDVHFPCGADSDNFRCWCATFPPLSPLTVSNHGCLCPACLAGAVQANSAPAHITTEPTQTACSQRSGFTLAELLVVVAIVCILAILLIPTLSQATHSANRVRCISNLRQLGLATQMYWDDNDGRCFRYRGPFINSGAIYWFGWIENGAEGHRTFDATQGALYPYLQGRGVEICPSMNYGDDNFKLKASGVSYGYGYNLSLSAPLNRPARSIDVVAHPADTALFSDAAQINTWQAPASPVNPMVEEWYYIDDNPSQPNAHFRHKRKANVQFCDGHIVAEFPVPGSIDPRLPAQRIGRLRTDILRGGF